MNKKELLEILRKKKVQSIFKRAGIEHLRLFGSYAKGTYTKDSDVDLLYEYNPQKDNSLGGVFSIYGYIKDFIPNDIDLTSRETVREELGQEIFNSSLPIY